ncbi:formylglycine-generating enzyme family protein [Portibacter lacus]|uniref:Sulfatase-modifying factor enzyme-like domain-containing protein n=1 Tax=Portibacter lacus TaxID=1099794 RepID=A0AA37WEC8_9BACT|nr:formylglycine-generating enzyme family protein [Portibacter lacus]GLR18656.1 hypothetical protein GCM10007940_32720 [Portibacter lacus]
MIIKISNLKIVFVFICLAFLVSCSDSEPKEAISGMVFIPAGTLNMGGDNEQASEDEYPKHATKVNGFYMDETEVTNAEFKKFVDATGYITVAEREIDWEVLKKDIPPGTPKPPDSLLQPGALVFHQTSQPVALDDPSKWWSWTIGASWQHPLGPDSDIKDKMDHPVVQISWEDAEAYANWAGKRLPTEAEWEWAARGGQDGQIYPWGNEAVDKVGHQYANFWQGLFPYENSKKDGFITTAPVKSFPPNGYGLYDMAGNVWEWCQDWYDSNYYQKEDAAKKGTDGPSVSYNPMNPYQASKVMRGGSFLCNDEYCSGYRNARRMQSSPDTGLNHAGFRCAKDL